MCNLSFKRMQDMLPITEKIKLRKYYIFLISSSIKFNLYTFKDMLPFYWTFRKFLLLQFELESIKFSLTYYIKSKSVIKIFARRDYRMCNSATSVDRARKDITQKYG